MDKANPSKSRDATNHTGNASVEARDTSGAGHTGNKTINGQAEHAPCTTAEARATQHSTGAFAKSTAAEADANAAFNAAHETHTGNEADAAIDASCDETEHADDSTRAGTRTRSRRKCAKASTQFTNRTAKQFAATAAIAATKIEFAAKSIVQ